MPERFHYPAMPPQMWRKKIFKAKKKPKKKAGCLLHARTRTLEKPFFFSHFFKWMSARRRSLCGLLNFGAFSHPMTTLNRKSALGVDTAGSSTTTTRKANRRKRTWMAARSSPLSWLHCLSQLGRLVQCSSRTYRHVYGFSGGFFFFNRSNFFRLGNAYFLESVSTGEQGHTSDWLAGDIERVRPF